MGNSLRGKRTVKVMKITGETYKLKTPVRAAEVVKDYPGHVLLESEAVKHYGIRAKPLEPHQDLLPKRLYFLVELPKAPTEKVPRRVRSDINVSAKDRLENLMLSRRSTSDLSILKPANIASREDKHGSETGAMRVKLRLPKAEVEKLMQESKSRAEAAAKIVDLCLATTSNSNHDSREIQNEGMQESLSQQQVHWNNIHQTVLEGSKARNRKRVSFLPVREAEMHVSVAS